jgi:glycosyltransferase involved in cell wall biosynthesis
MPPPQHPRILLLIPHLGGGGSERVIETLARSLNPDKYDIHLALITRSPHNSRVLPASITIHEFRATRVRHSAFKMLRLIWRVRPNLVLSGIAHLNLLILSLRPLLPPQTRIMIRQNGALSATLAVHRRRRLARNAYSLSYRRADIVISQTESMALELQRELQLSPHKSVVLANPTDLEHLRLPIPPASAELNRLTLLAIGRLVPEKGFDLLLEAFASLSAPFQFSELIIAGTGPEQSALQHQAHSLRIHRRVHVTGHVSDPVSRFRHASLFVLSSRTEGLPNALLEAAAAGFPIVATPASPGIADLLQNRQGVWLASDVSHGALRIALGNALTAIQPGQRYLHRWIEPYDLPHAIPAYENAIDCAIARDAF